MKTIDLKETYLKFFESKGHKIIPSAPIIPENDPTCLFNTAGMQPLVPYLKVNHIQKEKDLQTFNNVLEKMT